MLTRNRFFRRGWLFAALFQLLLPTFASVADARAEAESLQSAAAPHVEKFGEKGCPRVHPADCVLCRVLTMGATRPTPPAVQIAVARIIEADLTASSRPVLLGRVAGHPPQRAPPV
jgi:hypothetical protein